MNIPILPIWVNNEYNTFDVIALPWNHTRKYISEKIGLPIMFPYIFGWYGLWMPKRVRLSIIKGQIIKPQVAIEKMKNLHVQTIRSLSLQADSSGAQVTCDNHRE